MAIEMIMNGFLYHYNCGTRPGQEVKVRYADFGADEDEWINVKRAIRVQSVPVESSECTKVRVGDLVLCFRVCTYIYILF